MPVQHTYRPKSSSREKWHQRSEANRLCQFTQTKNLAHFLQVQHFWKLKQNKEKPPHKTSASDVTTAYCSKSHTEQQAVNTEYCFLTMYSKIQEVYIQI